MQTLPEPGRQSVNHRRIVALLAVVLLAAGCAASGHVAEHSVPPPVTPAWEVEAINTWGSKDGHGTLVVNIRGDCNADTKLEVRRCPEGAPDPVEWARLPDDFVNELRNEVVARVKLAAPASDQTPPDGSRRLNETDERQVGIHIAPGAYFVTVELGSSAPAIALLEPIAVAAGESAIVSLDLRAAVSWEIDMRLPAGTSALGWDQPGLLQVGGKRCQRRQGESAPLVAHGHDHVTREVRYYIQTFGGTPEEATLWCTWGANGLKVPLVPAEAPHWRYERTLTATLAPVRQVSVHLDPIDGGTVRGTTYGSIDQIPRWRMSGQFERPRSVRTLDGETSIFIRTKAGAGVLWEQDKTLHLREWFTISGDEVRLTGDGGGHFAKIKIHGTEACLLSLVPPLRPKSSLKPYSLGWLDPGKSLRAWIPDSATALEWSTPDGERGRMESLGSPSNVIP